MQDINSQLDNSKVSDEQRQKMMIKRLMTIYQNKESKEISEIKKYAKSVRSNITK